MGGQRGDPVQRGRIASLPTRAGGVIGHRPFPEFAHRHHPVRQHDQSVMPLVLLDAPERRIDDRLLALQHLEEAFAVEEQQSGDPVAVRECDTESNGSLGTRVELLLRTAAKQSPVVGEVDVQMGSCLPLGRFDTLNDLDSATW